MTKTKDKSSKMYVDNERFYEDIVAYKKKCRETPEGKLKPKIPDYSGKCIYLIAENIALMKNNRGEPAFAGYSFLEEMKSDGIENCIMYFDNFDEVRFKKPFAYFSRIIYFAFLRRIDFEKQQLYYKYKTALNHGIFNSISTPGSDSETASFEMYNNLVEYVDAFEKKKQKKKTEKSSKKITMSTSANTGNNHYNAAIYDILMPNTHVVSVSTGEAQVFCDAHNIKWSSLQKVGKVKGFVVINSKPYSSNGIPNV